MASEPESEPARGAAFRAHAKCMRRHEKALRRCQKRFSEKSVHKLRIETRRLLAQLELLGPFVPERTLRKVQRSLKKQLRASTFLRDAQVQLQQVRGLLPEHPELEPVYRHLKKNEQSLRRLARKKLKGGDKLLRRLKAIERNVALDLGAPESVERYREAVRLALRNASGRLADFRLSPPRDSAGIHRLRVALKKVRYMVESLPAELSVLTPAEIRLIRSHLDLTGGIHDLELLIVRLKRIATKKMREQGGLKPLWRSLRRDLSAQMQDWRRRSEEVLSSLDAISRADSMLAKQPGRREPSLGDEFRGASHSGAARPR